MKNIANKLTIVTGGSSGIGAATMALLSSNGITCFNADILPPESDIDNYLHCDVTRPDDVQNLFTQVWKVGVPDYLILCAGKGIHEQLHEGDPEKWQQVLDLNIMGNLRIIRAFAPGMLERKQGHIIIIGSVAATKAYTYGGVYAASKAAMAMIAETTRLELIPHVKVTTITLGTVETNFFDNMLSKEQHTATGLPGVKPETVADAILYTLNMPEGCVINEIVLRPDSQNF